MNHFDYVDGALHCEQVPLAAIADAVGTPVYVYSTATLERHYRVFCDAFAPQTPLVAYAVKANGNLGVIATLARLGAGADTVSAGEIARALAAGVPPERIIFSGVGKSAEELAFAIERGIHQINVESAAELALAAEVAASLGARPAIALRINPDIGAGAHDKITTGGADSKFGVSLSDAARLYAWAHTQPHLAPVGFAVHIGSQIRDLGPLAAAFAALRRLAEDVRAEGFSVTRLDLGGGLGVPYFHEPDPPSPADYAAVVRAAFDGFDAALSFEPGRLIAANAGVLVSTVLRLQDRPDRRILVLDAAMNDLMRPALYESYHDLKPLADAGEAPRTPADVVGPVCETGDTFTRARLLPPLSAGDRVAFLTAGAYGASMASTYNARPLVPEVLVCGDRWEIVRRRWSVAEQLALERVPDWG